MDKKDENSPSNLWTRRSNTNKSISSTNKSDREHHDPPSVKRFGSFNNRQSNPFNTVSSINTHAVSSPTGSGASASFGLGSGAFASFGSATKTPKTPGTAFDFGKIGAAGAGIGTEKKEGQIASDREENKRPAPRKSQSSLRPSTSSSSTAAAALAAGPSSALEAPPPPPTAKDLTAQWPLRHTWVMHYRPPSSKHSDYEKSIQPLYRIPTAQAFWQVYAHLKKPSSLPAVSDYHFFKDGIRPVWEDDENRKGGKWTMRLKKGVADRYWEDLLLALVGDQFAEASEEVCGAVVSVRAGEDVFSIWTKNDGGRNVKIRETVKRVLSLPPDTLLLWRSHDEAITLQHQAEHSKLEKSAAAYGAAVGGSAGGEKRRGTMSSSAAAGGSTGGAPEKREDAKA